MRSHVLTRITLDQRRLRRDLAYLAATPRIEEKYDEFSSGYWKNISLRNATGDSDDTGYQDLTGPAIPTAHEASTPYLRDLVDSVFNSDLVKMVRARNLIDAMVVPHRDFVELEKDSSCYFRTFMVLEDNHEALHSDDDTVIRMRPGEIWFLDAAAVHSAVNFSTASRQSICVDFAFENTRFDESDILVDRSIYAPTSTAERPHRAEFTPEHRDALLRLGSVIDRDNFKDIVFLLSKVHYRYQVPAEACYEWLTVICHKAADPELVDKAEALQRYMVGERDLNERFTIDTWTE